MWDLIERMVGGREFYRVGPEFLKALEFREVLLELWEKVEEHFDNEENII